MAEEAESFPPEFVQRVRGLLGEEAARFLRALRDPVPGLRVNTLRLDPERLRRMAPFALEPLGHPREGFRVDEGARPGAHPYHAAGLYYLQDPAAMEVAPLLAPEPGERVLDLAAAPGGKSTHLAALMRGRGVLVANDVHAGRARELAGNLERCGVRNALVTSDSAERLATQFGACFDRVLLDAPCSGEAMFHKSAAARSDWSPAAVLGCARRQEDLLGDAARLVRPGGLLVYSTCTFSPEEDEVVIARFLTAHPEFELAQLERVPGSEPGRPDWVPDDLRRADLSRTLRLWPHRRPGAGHFVAGLRRVRGEPAEPRELVGPALPRPARELLRAFRDRTVRPGRVPDQGLALFGTAIYAVPPGTPDPGRLRVLRPGWWLASLLRDRVEPAHALALGIAAEDALNCTQLGAEDPAVAAFLRGEPIVSSGAPGWTLVSVDGFALGWGKRVGDTVKNHYPKGLRSRTAAGA